MSTPRKVGKLQVSTVGNVALDTQSEIKRPNDESKSDEQEQLRSSDELDRVPKGKIDGSTANNLSGSLDGSWDADDERTSLADLAKLQENQIHAGSGRSMASSKFMMIKSKPVEEQSSSDRSKLSRNNFQFDVEGNAVMGDKILKQSAAYALREKKITKHTYKDGDKIKVYYRYQNLTFSDSDKKIIRTFVSKDQKKKINNLVSKETKEFRESNCWLNADEYDKAMLALAKEQQDLIEKDALKEASNSSTSDSTKEEITKMPEQSKENTDKVDSNVVQRDDQLGSQDPTIKEIPQVVPVNDEDLKQQIAELTKIMGEMAKQQAQILAQLQQMREENEALKKENEELKKPKLQTPETTQQAATPVANEWNKVQRNKEKNATQPKPKPADNDKAGPSGLAQFNKQDATLKNAKKPEVQSQPLVNKDGKITKFADDGIEAKLKVDEATTPKEALKVLGNQVNMTEDAKKKVTNQGVRTLTESKVKDSTFSEALVKDLAESEQTIKPMPEKPKMPQRSSSLITFNVSQKAAAKKDSDCPPGILPIRWKYLKNHYKGEKLEEATRFEYFKTLRSEIYIHRSKWSAHYKKVNPFLTNPNHVWEQIGQNDTNKKLHQAINVWRKTMLAFVPVGVTPVKNWFVNKKE